MMLGLLDKVTRSANLCQEEWPALLATLDFRMLCKNGEIQVWRPGLGRDQLSPLPGVVKGLCIPRALGQSEKHYILAQRCLDYIWLHWSQSSGKLQGLLGFHLQNLPQYHSIFKRDPFNPWLIVALEGRGCLEDVFIWGEGRTHV